MTERAQIILKEGYRLKFFGQHVLVCQVDERIGVVYDHLFLIDLRTVKQGEQIPRDTDEPMKWDL